LLAPDDADIQDRQFDSLFPILERTISMFSEDVEKNDLLLPQQHAKALRYIQAVKSKMQLDGVPQSKIDAYFKIDGPGNPLENSTRVQLFLLRPGAPLGGGPGGLVFNPAEMKGMVATGRGAAQEFVARLNPRDVSWLV
jgi:hypothetical protein